MSVGDADGLGEIRKKELVKSGLQLGIRSADDILVLEDAFVFACRFVHHDVNPFQQLPGFHDSDLASTLDLKSLDHNICFQDGFSLFQGGSKGQY